MMSKHSHTSAALKLPTGQIQTISVSEIEEDPQNERRQFQDVEKLASSIRQLGIVEPITVHREDDRYRIITGHRRFRAAKSLNQTEVDVVIVSNGDGKLRLRSLASNIQRDALNPVDVARGLQHALSTGLVKTQKELAAAIGKDETWVSGMLKICNMDPVLLAELEKTPNPPAYDCVIRVARIKDPEQQTKLVRKITSGATVQEIRAALRVDKRSHSPAECSVKSPHGYVAYVTGPDHDPERMLEAVSLLIKTLRASLPPEKR